MNPIEAYIRQAAIARGIDPDVAVRVANSEGGMANPYRHGEGPAPSSQDPRYGHLENSYGPFQLYVSGHGGGLGDRALAAGIDPQKNWQGGVDYALKEASQKGWGQWYGAAKAGVGNQTGIGADGPKGRESYPPVTMPNPQVGDNPAPVPVAAGPAQSPLGNALAAFANGFGDAGGGQADAGQPRVLQEGGFGANAASQQGAEQSKQLAFNLAPDIEKILALAPRPFARRPAAAAPLMG